ncbi:hypothetical protein ACTQ1D_04140 [Parafannyhessea umbonata]|uniref:hypothetical protein n=1 Tax=Parafannyhessea umbonata TaxID=604330 RepID=UPI003F991576
MRTRRPSSTPTGGENLNLPRGEEERVEAIEGMFTIQKSALEEPEIHEKVVKGPNGRKRLVRKKIMHFPHIDERIEDGAPPEKGRFFQ